MKCPNCGAVNRWEATRCEKCGTFIAQDTDQVSGQDIEQEDLLQGLVKEWPANDRPPDVPSKERLPRPDPKAYDLHRGQKFGALIYGTLAAAIIVTMIVLTFVVFSPAHDTSGHNNGTTGPLEGTWSASETTFFVRTNWSSDNLTDIGQENRTMTLVITGTEDPGMVQVEMSYSIISSNISSGTVYVTETTPDHFQAAVNGTTLVLDQNGLRAVLSFDGFSMTGTWDHTVTFPSLTEEFHTADNGLSFIKA